LKLSVSIPVAAVVAAGAAGLFLATQSGAHPVALQQAALQHAAPRQAATATAGSCPDVNVVFARGSGEPAGLGIVGTPFASALAQDLPGKTVTDYAVNYAANFAQTSAGPGATDMSNHVTALAAQCPGTQFVLGGYSQGASVTDIALGIRTGLGTGTAIPAADAGKIAAVVVYGNPLRLFGQSISTASPLYGSKADEFCNTGDPVCANGSNILAHLAYAANGDAQQGATFAAGQVTKSAG
jgi:cutinase